MRTGSGGRSGGEISASGPCRLQNESGFALLLTLLVTALLIALTAEFINEVYVDTSARQNFINAQQASLMAESGIAGGIKIVQRTLALQSYTALTDGWAQPLKLQDEAGELQITIQEESGKLNLNYLVLPNGTFLEPYHGMATRLFQKLKLPRDLPAALVDWVDENDEPQAAGAETALYQGLKPPYAAKNGKLESLEELLLVHGFTSAILEKVRPFVTVYPDLPGSPVAPINLNTAPREVVASLDEQMSDSLTDNILEYRKKTPFKAVADLARVPGMETMASRVSINTTVSGAVFRIVSLARVNDTSRIIEAVVRVDSAQAKVLYWREY